MVPNSCQAQRNLSVVVMILLLITVCGCSKFAEQRKTHYFNQGKELYDQGQFKKAMAEFKNALAFDEDYFDAVYLMGLCYYNDGRYDNAKKIFAKAVVLRPENIEVRLLLVDCLLELGRWGRAMLESKEFIDHKEYREKAIYNIIKASIKNSRIEWIPDDILQEFLDQKYDDARLSCLLSEMYARRGKFDEALEILNIVESRHNDCIDAMLFLADNFLENSQHDRYISLYRRIIQKAQDPFMYQTKLAEYFSSRGMQHEEEALLQDMLDQYPDRSLVSNRYFEFLLHYKHYERAKVFLQTCYHDRPDSIEKTKKLIRLYSVQGNYDKALAEADMWITLTDPASRQHTEAQAVKAEILFKKEAYKEAKAIVQNVLSKERMHIGALFLSARIDMVNDNPLQAIGLLRLLSSINRTDPKYSYYLGLAHLMCDDVVMAEKAFVDALELDPTHHESLEKLADIAFKTDSYIVIRNRLDVYLKSGGKEEDIHNILQRLSEIVKE